MLELLNKVKDSKEFKDYLKDHPNAYLCSIFLTEQQTQLSFYSKKTKLVTSFKVDIDKITLVGKDEKVLQKEKKDLEELHLEDLTIDLDKARGLVSDLLKEKYPNETPTKEITILQVIEGKTVWNITKITSTFNIINMKLDAFSGELLEEKMESALNFKKK